MALLGFTSPARYRLSAHNERLHPLLRRQPGRPVIKQVQQGHWVSVEMWTPF